MGYFNRWETCTQKDIPLAEITNRIRVHTGLLDREKCIKKPERSLYKFLFKYNKDGRQLKDLLRCTFVFNNKNDLQQGLEHIIAEKHADISLIKNGWANYTPDKHGEYVDVKIIFVLPDNGACCEVQMLTKPLYDVKKLLHGNYGMTRILNSTGSEFTDAIKKWAESVPERRRANMRIQEANVKAFASRIENARRRIENTRRRIENTRRLADKIASYESVASKAFAAARKVKNPGLPSMADILARNLV